MNVPKSAPENAPSGRPEGAFSGRRILLSVGRAVQIESWRISSRFPTGSEEIRQRQQQGVMLEQNAFSVLANHRREEEQEDVQSQQRKHDRAA